MCGVRGNVWRYWVDDRWLDRRGRGRRGARGVKNS